MMSKVLYKNHWYYGSCYGNVFIYMLLYEFDTLESKGDHHLSQYHPLSS